MIPKRFSLGWLLVPIVLPAAAIALIWMSMSAAGQGLHPRPQAIPSATAAAPAPQWSEATGRTRRIVRAGMAEQNLPGLSVAVGAGGRVVWAEGFGWADIEASAPVTPDTRFRIGTASTALTSAAVGVLLQKGDLKLDEEIQTYVPRFPKQRRPVTLRQLMAHTAGVGTDSGDEGPLLQQRCEQPVEALQHFGQDALLSEPGAQYRHSKYGWILMSAAVEAAADQPFLTFMRERIFEPLGMDNTGAESATEENPEHAGEPGEDAPFITLFRNLILQPLGMGGGAEARPETAPATIYLSGVRLPSLRIGRYGLHVARPRNFSCYAGSMAFFSTPSDLVRFGLAMNGGTLLQPATVEQLLTSQRLVSGQETDYGLGWELEDVTLAGETANAAGHDGELQGRRTTSFIMFRDSGIVVAVTSNKANADTSALALQVAEAFAPAGAQIRRPPHNRDVPLADEDFMRRALELAAEGEQEGEVPVGAVIVRDGKVIGRGHNRPIAANDPTAHAEVVALRNAAAAVGSHRLDGCDLYVTMEPCAMCAGAMVTARISRLIFGTRDIRFGAVRSKFRIADSDLLNHRIEVVEGMLAAECVAPLQRFFAARR